MAITLREGLNELNVGLTPVYVPPPVAQLTGVVTDSKTAYPIQGVKVTLDGLVQYTNAQGVYYFDGLEPSSYSIKFEKDGYKTLIM